MNEKLLECGHPESPHGKHTFGYSRDATGKIRSCYDCFLKMELADIEKSGRVFAYLTKKNGKHSVTGWPGYVISDDVLILKQLRDSFGGERTYLRFQIGDKIYSGFGMGVGMYLRARLTKLTSLHHI